MIRRAAPGAGWPLFGRDAEGVAWRPDPAVAEAARLAHFLRATGEPSLDALQARAVADPGWFWGAAADDLGLAWGRPPTAIVDLSGGPAWARWWTGASFDWSWAAVEPRAAADPDGTAITWEGEDGDVRSLTQPPSWHGPSGARPRDLPGSGSVRAIGSGSCCRCCSRPSWRCSR